MSTHTHVRFFVCSTALRIPSEIGRCTDLSVLSLETNDLSRSIPSQLGQLSRLEWLMLYDNKLSSSIPTELGSLEDLTWLRLEKNGNLRGQIPTELGSLTSLEHFSVQGTSVTGSVPSGFCDLIVAEQLMVGVECPNVRCYCGCYDSST